jgi:hypothetical protein
LKTTLYQHYRDGAQTIFFSPYFYSPEKILLLKPMKGLNLLIKEGANFRKWKGHGKNKEKATKNGEAGY